MSASGRNAPTAASAGGASGALIVGIAGGVTPSDGNNNANFTGPIGIGGQFSGLGAAASVFNGATWDRQRTPAVFKTALVGGAGDNAVWTPAAGKKFRLMGYSIEVPSFAALAAAAEMTLAWRDATTAIGLTHSPFLPAASVTTGPATLPNIVVNLGNGVLSALANNVLNLNLSAATTAGNFRVNTWGTEE